MGALTNTAGVSKTDRVAVGSQPDQTPATGGTSASGGGTGGAGLPTGGSAYQPLIKTGSGNYAAGWGAAPVFNVVDYGADASGSSTSNPAFAAANSAAASAGGGIVFMPPGRFKTTAPIALPNSTVKMAGSGYGGSRIVPTGGFDVFTAATGKFIFEDFGIFFAAVQSSHSAINIAATTGPSYINRVFLSNGFTFLSLGTDNGLSNINWTWVSDCMAYNCGGTMFALTGYMGNLYIRDVLGVAEPATAGTQVMSYTGTHGIGCDVIDFRASDFEQYENGILFNFTHATDTLSDSFFDGIILDGISASAGIAFTSANGAQLKRMKLRDLWITTTGGSPGIQLDSDYHASTFSCEDFTICGCNVSAASSDGMQVGAVDEVSLTGSNQFYGCTNGLHVKSTAGFVDVVGNRIGGPYTGNTVGVLLDSGAKGGIITQNDLRGNSTALTNNWGANSAGVRYVATNLGADV